MKSTDSYMLVVMDLFSGPEYKTIHSSEADNFSPEKVSTDPKDPWYGYILLDDVCRSGVDSNKMLGRLRRGNESKDCNLPPNSPKIWKQIAVPHLFCFTRDTKCDGTCQ